MIWRHTAPRHLSSIGAFARSWVGGTLFDRLIPVTIAGWFWMAAWFWIGIFTRSPGGLLFCMLVGLLPWVWLLLDARVDANAVESDVAYFMREGAILATRCEYLGGHPELPHGRFAYLLLEGTRENPHLTLLFPKGVGNPPERYRLPILDFQKTKPEPGSSASVAADIAAVINRTAGSLLRPERLTLVVDYDGPGGRTHKVEFTNFFHGNNEIRNWRNYLVCAQAQADFEAKPHEPWVSLPPEPVATESDTPPPPPSPNGHSPHDPEKESVLHAFARNGHKEEHSGSAFIRR